MQQRRWYQFTRISFRSALKIRTFYRCTAIRRFEWEANSFFRCLLFYKNYRTRSMNHEPRITANIPQTVPIQLDTEIQWNQFAQSQFKCASELIYILFKNVQRLTLADMKPSMMARTNGCMQNYRISSVAHREQLQWNLWQSNEIVALEWSLMCQHRIAQRYSWNAPPFPIAITSAATNNFHSILLYIVIRLICKMSRLPCRRMLRSSNVLKKKSIPNHLVEIAADSLTHDLPQSARILTIYLIICQRTKCSLCLSDTAQLPTIYEMRCTNSRSVRWWHIRVMHMRQIANCTLALGPFTLPHTDTQTLARAHWAEPLQKQNEPTTPNWTTTMIVWTRYCVCVHVDVSQQSTHISIIIRLIYPRKQTIL